MTSESANVNMKTPPDTLVENMLTQCYNYFACERPLTLHSCERALRRGRHACTQMPGVFPAHAWAAGTAPQKQTKYLNRSHGLRLVHAFFEVRARQRMTRALVSAREQQSPHKQRRASRTHSAARHKHPRARSAPTQKEKLRDQAW